MDSANNKPAVPATGSKQKPLKKKWSLKKKVSVIVGAVVIFFLAIFVIASVATDAPRKVSNEYVSAIQSGDASAAFDLMSAAAQSATGSQNFETIVDQIGPILTGEPEHISSEVNAETGSDPTAKVIYEVEGNDGNTYTLTVDLQQNDGRWEVLTFESDKKE